uniref:C2H2-type domain-containing protein n=1 Tax=Astatotilapia calliptera TaxID=8154 RepID=A0A3P8Q4H3_ASTCA
MDSSSPSNSGSSSLHSGNRKQSAVSIPDRIESCYDRKADKGGYGGSQGSVTVTSLKSRLAPTIQTAMSAAVDTLLGEVVLVLNETQQELLHKEQENERLKVRLEVSERELKTLQECLCSAQKLIDQLQVSYTGPQSISQSVFAPPLSSMDSIATGDGERSSHNVGDLGYGQVGGEAGSQRSFPHPLRHQRPMRECSSALGGLNGQKQLARTPGAGRGDSASSGGADDSAGPSAPDTAVVEPPGDRPHHCLECGKTFRLISSLKKHIRIHTGEKPYPCGVCGRRFRESGALKTHLRIHTGEKPYSCSECGNCFRHLDGLRKHRRTHTGEKPYVCAICGKRLSRLQHLKHHQLIHTGERPCCCPFCNRTFKEPAALRKHIRTHREEGEVPRCCLMDHEVTFTPQC